MSNDPPDPYSRLRPLGPTPEDDLCRCPEIKEVMLRGALSPNRLYCVRCRGVVPPERLGFDARLADAIADWVSVHDSLYRLWPASGEYEKWAAERLEDPLGEVNAQGRDIVARLNAIVPAYSWWFVASDVIQPEDFPACPICAGQLTDIAKNSVRECSLCRILV